jgi:hypothetical protein
VEAGRHQVRFRYTPASYRVGLLLSAAPAAIAVVMFIRPYRRDRSIAPADAPLLDSRVAVDDQSV